MAEFEYWRQFATRMEVTSELLWGLLGGCRITNTCSQSKLRREGVKWNKKSRILSNIMISRKEAGAHKKISFIVKEELGFWAKGSHSLHDVGYSGKAREYSLDFV